MIILLSPLVQWIIAIYFLVNLIVNLMLLGALLAMRLALTTAQAFGELKKPHAEVHERHITLPNPLSGRHDKAWRHRKRWELLNRKSANRRRKGGKSWM